MTKPTLCTLTAPLLDAAKMARATGFCRWFVEAVKAQSDSPFKGGRYARQPEFEQWVQDHPSFRASHYWAARKEKRKLEDELAMKAARKLKSASV